MIRFLSRKNDLDLTRLAEKTTPVGTDKFPLETTGSGDLRSWVSWTNLLATIGTSVANVVVPTGVMVPWLTATAPAGWVLASGNTVGSAASGATARANADTAALYSLLWQAFSNTERVIQDSAGTPTTRGVSAAADFDADKRLPLPDLRDRAIIGLANMGGTDAARIGVFDTTAIGKSGGSDTHTLTVDQIPPHTHTTDVPTETVTSGTSGADVPTPAVDSPIESSSTGGGEAFPIVQPSIVLPFIIKL